MKTHKFKVGDKVRILPSAIKGGVSKKVVGLIGKIRYSRSGYFEVIVNSTIWAVYPDQIKPVVEIGEQLLFAFMDEEE